MTPVFCLQSSESLIKEKSLNQSHGGNIYEISERYGLQPSAIIDFSVSINPFGLSKKAERKLKQSLADVLHYPDPKCSELKRTLAQYHGLAEEQILVGAGSTEFIYAIPRVLSVKRPLIVTPAFSEYENALECSPGRINVSIHYLETKEEDGFELCVESLLFALTQGYDALYLGNPNNPTGILTEKEDLLKILAQAEREKVWFILDEAFIDFVEEESFKREVISSSRLIILRSLTNFFALPGLRVGYLIAHPETIQHFSRNKEPWTVNALAQIAARVSLQDAKYIRRTKEWIKLERNRLTQGLRAIPGFIPYPGKANYLLVEIHPNLRLDAAELREKLISYGILIRDCRSFHHIGPYFFRVAVRGRRENNALLKALRRVR
ncbi:MAG: threonine-phosphate decarboxylase [Deltaproteobacteria bacterium]|nr:threonine-phosphate decarboxylase [Deltaproteobacteria bacterium]